MIAGVINMKRRIFVNNKPLEDLTIDERKQMDLAIAKAFKDVFGFIVPIEKNQYDGIEQREEKMA